MGVSYKVKVDHALFAAGRSKMRRAAVQAFNNILAYTTGQAKKFAPVKTGHLRRSIDGHKTGEFSGRVGSAIIYARIQELGGIIRPKNKKYLRFKVGNQWVFAKQSKIKGKFYLKRAAEQAKAKAPELIRAAIRSVK